MASGCKKGLLASIDSFPSLRPAWSVVCEIWRVWFPYSFYRFPYWVVFLTWKKCAVVCLLKKVHWDDIIWIWIKCTNGCIYTREIKSKLVSEFCISKDVAFDACISVVYFDLIWIYKFIDPQKPDDHVYMNFGYFEWWTAEKSKHFLMISIINLWMK